MIIKRLPTKISYRDDILLYGGDNLYPQRVEAVVQRSPITHSAIQVTADFLNGEGWEANGGFKLGDSSANQLLVEITPDFSLFNAISLLYDINMLGEIVEVKQVPFKHVRLGVPNKDNEITYAKVYTDWEDELPSSLRPKMYKYPLWVSKEHALRMIEDWDFDTSGEFPGFLHYITPVKNTYPLATIDSVIDSSQTNAEIQLFELAGVQNGFLGATLIKHQGKIGGDDERRRLESTVASIKGSENANSVIIWEVPDGYEGSALEQFPANNQDRLFENTNKTTVNRITQTLAIPPALLGIMPDGVFYSRADIEESFTYYNYRTKNRRNILSDLFLEIGRSFIIQTEFGKIVIQQYL